MTRDTYFSSQSNKLELIENNTNTNSKQLKNDDGFDDDDVDVDDEYDDEDRMDESDDVDDQTYDVLGMDQEKSKTEEFKVIFSRLLLLIRRLGHPYNMENEK